MEGNEIASSTNYQASSEQINSPVAPNLVANQNSSIPAAVETQLPVEKSVVPETNIDSVVAPKVEIDPINPEDLDEVWSRWKCLVCGYNYEGRLKIVKCPKCGNEDPDKFEDAD